MNNITLMGRLTADPELNKTPNGTSVLKITLAVDKFVNGEKKANFIPVVAWRQTAELIAKYFRKGNQLALIGTLETRQYQDKETGKNRTAFEVVANSIFFAGNNSNTKQENTEQPPDDFAPFTSNDGDLPF